MSRIRSIGGGSHGSHGVGPIRRLVAKIRSHHSGGGGGSLGGGSTGGIVSSYGGGGSTGSVATYGGYSSIGSGVSYASAPVVSAPVEYASYESPSYYSDPVVHEGSSFSNETIVDGGYVDSGYVDGGVVSEGYVGGGYSDGGVVSEGYVDGGYADGGIVSEGYPMEGSVIQEGFNDGGVVYDSAPVESYSAPIESGSTIESPAAEFAPEETGFEESRREGDAYFAISVPTDAVVYINGFETSSTGAAREYVSSGLELTRDYTYEIRAVVNRDSTPVTQSKFVTVRAGENVDVDFAFAPSNSNENVTTLTLNVPEDAKVSLAGNDTNMSGTQRVFATKQLAAGQVWDDYKVVVTLERDGQLITKEKDLVVRGGDTYELSFDFTGDQLASK